MEHFISKSVLFILITMLCIGSYAQNCNESNSLVSVRKRKAGRTEYVIFTLKKQVTATSEITDAKPPFVQDGSGENISVKGCKYKKVEFRQIVWQCKTNEITGNTYLVQQLKNIGQFEGIIEYIIGYRCITKSVVSYDYDDGDFKKIVVRLKY